MKSAGKTTSAAGKSAAAGLKRAAKKDENKTEAAMGKEMPKGAKAFDNLAKKSDGKSAGAKQR